MKKFVFVSLFALGIIAMQAQSLGVKGGVNMSSFTGKGADDLKSIVGWQLGLTYEKPIAENVYLQPELNLIQKGAKYELSESGYKITDTYKPVYLEIPINFVYKFNAGPGKLYIGAGPYLAFGLAGKYKYEGTYEGESESGSSNLFTKEDGADKAMMKRFDAGISGVVGYEYNKLVFSLSTSNGLTNISNESGSDNALKNSTVSLSIGYKLK